MASYLIATYIALSFVLATYFYFKYQDMGGDSDTLISLLIVLWSGLMYTNHITGFIPSPDLYYADWILTTPLLVYLLAKEVDASMLAVSTQFMTILFGWLDSTGFLGLSQVWASLSLISFVATIGLLTVYAQKAYSKPVLSFIIVATFTAYPVIFYANGGTLVGATTSLVILPLISKHAFTLLKEEWY